MLGNHEYEINEKECAGHLNHENLSSDGCIVTAISWAKLSDIEIFIQNFSTFRFLKTESTEADTAANDSSKTLCDKKREGESEVSHPVCIALLKEETKRDSGVKMCSTYWTKYLCEHKYHEACALRSWVWGISPVNSDQ